MYESVLRIGGSQCAIGVIFAFALGMIVNVAIDQTKSFPLAFKANELGAIHPSETFRFAWPSTSVY